MVQKSSVPLSTQQGRTRWPEQASLERHRGFSCPFHKWEIHRALKVLLIMHVSGAPGMTGSHVRH